MSTAPQLTASVGHHAVNRRPDVAEVQRLLKSRGFNPGAVDGRCGPRTVAAILAFQHPLMRRPDGRVDVGGRTWTALVTPGGGPTPPTHANTPILTRLVPRPAASSLNPGLGTVDNVYMQAKFGSPRTSYTGKDQPITNDRLSQRMVTASVGPFKVTGLRPAVASLDSVMAEIKLAQPAVYQALSSAGMLCCRYQSESSTVISMHSWGVAIDLKLNGVLDPRGDNNVQYGLTLIAPIFNRFGWYWGAKFRTEDGMHFESGRSLLDSWAGTP